MKKVAALQMCSSADVDDNLKQAALLVAEAAEKGNTLAVLPEMFSLFGKSPADIVMIREKPGIGKIQDTLAALALKHRIWLVGGTIPLAYDDEHKIKAAALVFDHHGHQVARYDKIHLFDARLSEKHQYQESETTMPGSQIIVLATPIGRLGLCVCYDMRFPELFLELVAQGAEVIAVPAAFTMPTGAAHWALLARCRAIDTFCYIIGACQGGRHANGRETYGHSMIVSPWGAVLSECMHPGPGMCDAVLDLNSVYELRQKIPIRKKTNAKMRGWHE